MSKNKNNNAENPEVENPQIEESQIEQPVTEQLETEPEKTEVEEPEVEEPEAEPEPEDNVPDYVKELLEKGVVVLTGRSCGELGEKLAAIPADIDFYTGAIDHYLATGLYRIQVNKVNIKM